jgi:HlyD family secretion protein
MKIPWKTLVVLGCAGGAIAAGYPSLHNYWKSRHRTNYRELPVVRGDIVSVVNSTGTVQPVQSVQVGSFVSGPIFKTLVDFNSRVKKGDLLAKIDPRTFEANVARDQATLATKSADVEQINAKLQQAINDEKRAETLRAKNREFISDTEMDQFKFNRMSLDAQLKLDLAAVEEAKATLSLSKANLDYTDIKSPVDGVIIDRKVDPGQTVAAQFQTPVLFVVAPDMEQKMYVYASVDEADIGLIRDAQRRKQPVYFTVDAYPDDLFSGSIGQVRMNPTTTQNVVTYTVVVEAPNAELKLLPGMTANLSFQIDKHEKILKIPNAALRFYPKPDQVRPEDRALLEGADPPPGSAGQPDTTDVHHSASEKAAAARERNRHHVWILDGEELHAIAITTGMSDSSFTEFVEGQLTENKRLVTGVQLFAVGPAGP